MIDQIEQIRGDGNLLYLADHEVRFSKAQESTIHHLMQIMRNNPYAPPAFTEAANIVGEDVLIALIEMGEIIRVQPEVIFDQKGEITASELRDKFQTTRKYAIGLLEHLDNIKVTRRQGDVRVRGPNA